MITQQRSTELEGDQLSDGALTVLARRCRSVLAADVVLVAVRRSGWPAVVSDADLTLDPAELAHQVALAELSLDDPVLDGRPGLSPRAGEEPAAATVVDQHLRRLVVRLPQEDGVRGTLTVGRRPPFAADEVDLAMTFASLAHLVLAQGRAPGLAGPCGASEEAGAVGRLFAVGLALHLILRSIDDHRLRPVVEEAIDQLDRAMLDIRQASVATPQG